MLLPNGKELMHDGAPYNPEAAHKYYMDHRKLHPRVKKGTYTIKSKNGKTYKISAEKLAEQKEYATHRVEQLKQNLKDLNVILKDKLEAAKADEKKKNAKPTLADRAKQARADEAYRKSHKTEIATKAKESASKSKSSSSSSSKKSSTSKADTVDSVKNEITKAKTSLKTAIANQRELAQAKKNG